MSSSSRKSKKKQKTPRWYCQVDGSSQQYDAQSAERLEKAYQKGKDTTVALKHGYFASQRGVYQVIFQLQYDRTFLVSQLNSRTGFQRPVHRKPAMKRIKKKKKKSKKKSRSGMHSSSDDSSSDSGSSSSSSSSDSSSSSSELSSSDDSSSESEEEESSGEPFDFESSESSSETKRRRRRKVKKRNARKKKATDASAESGSGADATEMDDLAKFHAMPEDDSTYKWFVQVDGTELELANKDKIRVEEAYRSPKRKKQVQLKRGWYGKQAAKYFIIFERTKKFTKPTKAWQMNSMTGFKRPARREPSMAECEKPLREQGERLSTLADVAPHLRLLTARDFECLGTDDLTCNICFEEFKIETDLYQPPKTESSGNERPVATVVSKEEDKSRVVFDGLTEVTEMMASCTLEIGDDIKSSALSSATTDEIPSAYFPADSSADKSDLYTDDTSSSIAIAKSVTVEPTVSECKEEETKGKDGTGDTGAAVDDDDSDDSSSDDEKRQERAPDISLSDLLNDRPKASILLRQKLDAETIDSISCSLADCPSHLFHIGCIYGWLRTRMQCPVCKKAYGVVTGNQPNGEIYVNKTDARCAGYERSTKGSYHIIFHIPSGTQTDKHPNPGAPYFGDSREVYLPRNEEGKMALKLIRKAWKRKLIFTIGYSLTRQIDGVVIWNGIHMKTSLSGGKDAHGWPDEGYFDRLKEEMKAKGVELTDKKERSD